MSFLQTLSSIKNTITETQFRTILKTITYRVTSSLLAVLTSKMFGASLSASIGIGIFVLVFGFFTYYLNERIWLKTGWARNNGDDNNTRSLVKTVIYRTFIFFVGVITSYVAIEPNWETGFYYAALQIPLHSILYFVTERFFNKIGWGKKPVVE